MTNIQWHTVDFVHSACLSDKEIMFSSADMEDLHPSRRQKFLFSTSKLSSVWCFNTNFSIVHKLNWGSFPLCQNPEGATREGPFTQSGLPARAKGITPSLFMHKKCSRVSRVELEVSEKLHTAVWPLGFLAPHDRGVCVRLFPLDWLSSHVTLARLGLLGG